MIEKPRLVEDDAEITGGLGVIRVEVNGLFEILERGINVISFVEDDTKIIVEVRVMRIDFERRCKMFQGPVEVPTVKLGDAQFAPSFCRIEGAQFGDGTLAASITGENLFQAPDGLVVITFVKRPDSFLVLITGGASKKPAPERQFNLRR